MHTRYARIERSQDGRHRLIWRGQPQWICGAEVHNSTASNPMALESAFQRAKELGANTVLSPVTWEMLEPEEDIWDFSQMKWALASAEAKGLAWIPLWFGTLKNGQSTYVPPWVKKDPDRFPWAQDRSGRILRTLSLFSEETLQADCRAFGKFLEALSDVGAEHHVPLIQVQNEPGLLGSARDFSALAEPFYGQPTPPELGGKSWQETFGEGSEGAFSAWATARFVGRVASVGMAEFPVPRFTNVWLDEKGQEPGIYPSGGGIARHHDIWSLYAPDISFLAPDIYSPEFERRASEYATPRQPVFVPETGVLHSMGNVELLDHTLAARALWLFGEVDSLGISPFGFDRGERLSVLAETYKFLGAHLDWRFSSKAGESMRAGIIPPGCACDILLGDLVIQATATNAEQPGALLVRATSTGKVSLAGLNLRLSFRSKATGTPLDFLSAVQTDGTMTRRLNGDDLWGAQVSLPLLPCWLEVELFAPGLAGTFLPLDHDTSPA